MARDPTYVVVIDNGCPPALDKLPLRDADEFLSGETGTLAEGLVVINLCRSYQYLSKGYYVSLLAQARRQHVLPTLDSIEEVSNPFAYFRALRDAGVDTIDFKIIKGRGRRLLPKVIVLDADAIEREPQAESLVTPRDGSEEVRYEPVGRRWVEVTAVFGKTTDERFRRHCSAVSKVFAFPILRIRMYEEEEGWRVGQIFPGALAQLSATEMDLLAEQIGSRAFTASKRRSAPSPKVRLACLLDESDPYAPSDEETIEKLGRIAARMGVVTEIIEKDDLQSLAEYDALFIRTVTAIDNYAFTFAKVAESLGIPVLDDTRSIIRCSNKVYLHEIFRRNGIPTPPTRTISRKSTTEEITALGFPLIVKLPDGTFSQAVKKVSDAEDLKKVTHEMFRESPLLIVQAFMPTPFDWRVGILDGDVLFVCKYHMVKDHWQIARRSQKGHTRYGRVEAVAIAESPEAVRTLALQAAGLIGNGLYGVDLKETDSGPVVIEVNDNPNLETGYEDAVEKDRIYERIVGYFVKRIEAESRLDPDPVTERG